MAVVDLNIVYMCASDSGFTRSRWIDRINARYKKGLYPTKVIVYQVPRDTKGTQQATSFHLISGNEKDLFTQIKGLMKMLHVFAGICIINNYIYSSIYIYTHT